jgi:hypothetical protein
LGNNLFANSRTLLSVLGFWVSCWERVSSPTALVLLLERSGLLAKPQFPVVLINANKKNFYAGSSARNTFASTAAIGAVAAQ